MSRSAFFILHLLYNGVVCTIYYADFLHPYRIHRHCHRNGDKAHKAVPFEGNKFTLTLAFLSAVVCLLIALGVIKGLIGFCVPKVGCYGLHLLIDLPRPLAQYQEKDLKYRPVVYDVGGWPVHPDTQQRTVRVLSKRTEFCLNIIFFLACPLAACAYICSLCCCIRNCSKESREDTCFRHVDIIRLEDDSMKRNCKNENCPGFIYREQKKEEEDTRYVINAMQKSKESIHELRN